MEESHVRIFEFDPWMQKLVLGPLKSHLPKPHKPCGVSWLQGSQHTIYIKYPEREREKSCTTKGLFSPNAQLSVFNFLFLALLDSKLLFLPLLPHIYMTSSFNQEKLPLSGTNAWLSRTIKGSFLSNWCPLRKSTANQKHYSVISFASFKPSA